MKNKRRSIIEIKRRSFRPVILTAAEAELLNSDQHKEILERWNINKNNPDDRIKGFSIYPSTVEDMDGSKLDAGLFDEIGHKNK